MSLSAKEAQILLDEYLEMSKRQLMDILSSHGIAQPRQYTSAVQLSENRHRSLFDRNDKNEIFGVSLERTIVEISRVIETSRAIDAVSGATFDDDILDGTDDYAYRYFLNTIADSQRWSHLNLLKSDAQRLFQRVIFNFGVLYESGLVLTDEFLQDIRLLLEINDLLKEIAGS
ncbi:hypothetical protein [Moraxella nasicaprae]|uniref:Uncharacterized protein n=1 Tax=Moraxella nasicaprae TaxID=2904122 RepID=A0ABY6F3J6_9GAMM|nr:hypothetical protein [Moraxella nasicaprae]UXZ04668.1 hypothetical protein LU297_08880 [Moraxella nasicaprae]